MWKKRTKVRAAEGLFVSERHHMICIIPHCLLYTHHVSYVHTVRTLRTATASAQPHPAPPTMGAVDCNSSSSVSNIPQTAAVPPHKNINPRVVAEFSRIAVKIMY